MGGILSGSSDFKANPNAKPKAGESTGPQNTTGGANLGIPTLAGLQYQQAGGGINGLGIGLGGLFPGQIPGMSGGAWGGVSGGWLGGNFIQPRKGNYSTYRWMSLDPTLRLIRSLIWSPILSSQWTVNVAEHAKIVPTGNKVVRDSVSGRVKTVPQGVVDMISDMFLPLRRPFLNEALRYMEFGARFFERVYEIRDGRFWLKKPKPLLPEFCQILHDGGGNFGGLCVGMMGSMTDSAGNGSLAPNKSFVVSHDVEAGNLYGISRHEAAFDAWCDANQTRSKMWQLEGKLSGVLPTVYYRPGQTPINEKMCDNYEVAKQIGAVAYAGGCAVVPTTEYSDTDLQENPELAKLAPWRLEIVNAGSYAPAMDGMIRELEYRDKLKIRAWGWPERAAIEAQSGGIGTGDAAVHQDAGELDLEGVDQDLAAQISQGQPLYDVPGLIDEALRLNCGDEAVGAVRVDAAPLSDPKVAVYQGLVDAVFANPKLAAPFSKIPDWEDVFNTLDIKCVDDVDEQLPAILELAQQNSTTPAPTSPMTGPDGKPLPGSQLPNGRTTGKPIKQNPLNARMSGSVNLNGNSKNTK